MIMTISITDGNKEVENRTSVSRPCGTSELELRSAVLTLGSQLIKEMNL